MSLLLPSLEYSPKLGRHSFHKLAAHTLRGRKLLWRAGILEQQISNRTSNSIQVKIQSCLECHHKNVAFLQMQNTFRIWYKILRKLISEAQTLNILSISLNILFLCLLSRIPYVALFSEIFQSLLDTEFLRIFDTFATKRFIFEQVGFP